MSDRPMIEELRQELAEAAVLDNQVERTLTVVALITAALEDHHVRPVLVGGMAVLYWTEFADFVTTDIDVVVEQLPAVTDQLAALGFERGDSRHWVLPGTAVTLEAPEGRMISGATVRTVEVRPGLSADVLSLVDVAVVRLEEFQATGHPLAGHQALVLLRHVSPEERPRLFERAQATRVVHALEPLLEIADLIASGERGLPESYEFHEIADAAKVAEYRVG